MACCCAGLAVVVRAEPTGLVAAAAGVCHDLPIAVTKVFIKTRVATCILAGKHDCKSDLNATNSGGVIADDFHGKNGAE